jgi:Ca2+-binding RTX toxin-like protein
VLAIMIIAQDDSVYDNYDSLTGAPAVRVTGLRVRFNNHTGGSLQSDDPAFPAIIFDGTDGTLFNETGAAIRAALGGTTAIAGSSGVDTMINDGTIEGDVQLGGGDDSFDSHAGTVSGAIYGFDGDDTLTGGSGGDTLDGGAGDDLLDGGTGADAMTGGTGNDIFYVDDAGDVVTENGSEGDADEVRTSLSGYQLPANVEKLTWVGAGAGDLRGNAGDNILTGGASGDFFRLQDGGNDSASGGAGGDAFYFGAAYTQADSVDGGAQTDVVALQGDYSGGVTLGTLTGVETLTVLPSGDNRFGGGGASPFSYVIFAPDSSVAAGTQLQVNASTLGAGENLTFDGHLESDGSFFIYGGKGVDTLTGGAGADVFFFAEDGRFAPTDHIDGGAGQDILVLRGNYSLTLSGTSLVNVETVTLLSGSDARFYPSGTPFSYDIATAEDTVANGQTMIFNGGRLSATETLHFDGSAETNGNFRLFGGNADDVLTGGAGNDLLYGGLGHDVLNGGGGLDVYQYKALAESTGSTYDTIIGFRPGQNAIDLPGHSISQFDSQLLSGTLSTASFDSDLGAAIGSAILGAGKTVLFRPDAGDLAGALFLVADFNGVAGYQASQDYVFRLEQLGAYVAAIDSPSVAEGNSGTTPLVFTITLDHEATSDVTIAYQTVSGTAAAGTDYASAAGQLVIAAGQQSGTVTVQVNGDTAPESDETLRLEISGAQLAASTGATGTILNDEPNSPIVDGDRRTGGPGYDTLSLDGDVSLTTNSLFSGYEAILLGTRRDEDQVDGHTYSFIIDNDNAPNDGTLLTIDGSALAADTDGPGPLIAETLYFDASAVFSYSIDLRGGAADDVVKGTFKDDVISTGAGNDLVYYINGYDRMDFGSGTDTLDMSGFTFRPVEQTDPAYLQAHGVLPGVRFFEIQLIGGNVPKIDAQDLEVIRGGRLALTAGSGTLDLSTAFSGYNLQFVNTTLFVPTSTAATIVKFGSSIPAPFTEMQLNQVGDAVDTVDFSQFGQAITMTSDVDGASVLVAAGGTTFAHYSGFPTVIGTAFADTIIGTIWNSTLNGGGGDDRIYGSSRTDTLNGGDGNDTLSGNLGPDSLNGGNGDDVLIDDDMSIAGRSGNDILDGGDGIDTLDLQSLARKVDLANHQSTSLGGDTSTDQLFNIENVLGSTSNDTIIGDGGNNVLGGRGGNDILTGAGGADTFLFNTALSASGNVDQITDFAHGVDSIALDNGIFTALADGALPASAFALGTSATDANQHILYDSNTGALYYDPDGSGAAAAIQFATVTAGTTLTASDFIVV